MSSDWEMTRLGDLFEITSSKRVHKEDWRSEGIPFFRAREIVQFFQTGAVRQELYITPEMYHEFKSKYGVPQPEDLLVTGVGTLGVCYRVRDNVPFYFKDGNIIWLKKRNDSDSRFIEYAFQSDLVRDQIMSGSQGATVGTYTIEKANETLIPIPPLPEQQRIVTKLDAAFAALAEAQAHVERNRANARELFESYLNGVFEGKGDWEERTLGEMCTIRSGTTLPPGVEKPSGELAYLKVADMSVAGNERHVTTSSRFVDRASVKTAMIFPVGTTIFPKRGGAILTNKKRLTSVDIVADLNIMGLTPQKDLLPEFLFHYFLRLDLREINNGSSIPQINNYSIEPLLINYPASLKEQRRVVDKLGEVYQETNQLETTYAQKLTELEGLKKAVLGAAFRGEL